jgi:hypothetical protein
MREVKLNVAVIDLGKLVSSGMYSLDSLYLKVIELFRGFTCFVYVQGMEKVEDLFLKWCCEVILISLQLLLLTSLSPSQVHGAMPLEIHLF